MLGCWTKELLSLGCNDMPALSEVTRIRSPSLVRVSVLKRESLSNERTGESAGAGAVMCQMILYGGDPTPPFKAVIAGQYRGGI